MLFCFQSNNDIFLQELNELLTSIQNENVKLNRELLSKKQQWEAKKSQNKLGNGGIDGTVKTLVFC